MTDNRLLRLQKMAQRFNEIGAVSDDTVRNIATRVQAQEQYAQREQHDQMDGARIKMLRTHQNAAQTARLEPGRFSGRGQHVDHQRTKMGT